MLILFKWVNSECLVLGQLGYNATISNVSTRWTLLLSEGSILRLEVVDGFVRICIEEYVTDTA